MPKYRKEIAEAKAKNLSKAYINADLNQTTLAQREGVTSQAINQRINRAPVQKTLQDIIDKNLKKAGITAKKVYNRINEELDATRVISATVTPDGKQRDATGQTCDFIEVPNHYIRDKGIEKCLTLMGHIKQNGKNGHGGVSIMNIIYAYRPQVNAN